MLLNKDFYFTTAAKAVVIAECIEDRWRRQLGIEPRVLIDQSELAQGTPSPTATDDGRLRYPHMSFQSIPVLPTGLKPVSARRCLFPSTTTAEQRFAWTRELENKFLEQDRQKSILWGFDFQYDRPLEDDDNMYGWEMVPENQVPSFYRSQVAADRRGRQLETDFRRSGTTSRLLHSKYAELGIERASALPRNPKSYCAAFKAFALKSRRESTSTDGGVQAGSTQSHINNFFPVSKLADSETDKKPYRGQQQQEEQEQSDNRSDSDEQQNVA
ncbi:Cyclin-dependent kinase inhibitor 1 [Trichinella pseudospiralis]|uniref:Cyclin-dependent kinase inhibitor 1 n=1 Tax=Trichinella pseudospiralis TaxID=6337 RepID=A0A0V1IT67_TRIPS|nr:Cyclin-dependent kinase inhibitor 1 [Trichinella pseudospiralis]KRZ26030.1 Cyclin-dependent kinase inhibitor 1 [Trichinella pseudospiralis]KRZ31349.1 Cyclin-dependent kinase inhibitor 1 [Trichinella pseudospiralis]